MRKVRYIGHGYFSCLTIDKVYDVFDCLYSSLGKLEKICIIDDFGNYGSFYIYDIDETPLFEEAIDVLRNDAINDILE